MSGNGDYISREALLSATEGYDWRAGLKTVLKRIPAADVRPVVFCGDCARYFGKEDGGYTAGYCKRTYVSVGPFDFCSRGEKRDETAAGR